METKFKIGDKVLATKPNNQDDKFVRLVWISGMNKFDKQILKVKETDKSNNIYLCTKYGHSFWFHESWLTKVEGITPEEPQANEEKQIDWEQRKWDLASKIYAESENVTLESAIRQAEIFINYYKTKSDENRNY